MREGCAVLGSSREIGQLVKFKDYAGNDLQIDGESYSLVRMVDILCISDD